MQQQGKPPSDAFRGAVVYQHPQANDGTNAQNETLTRDITHTIPGSGPDSGFQRTIQIQAVEQQPRTRQTSAPSPGQMG